MIGRPSSLGPAKRDRLPQAVLREVWLRSGGFCQCGSACAGHAGAECGTPLPEDAWFAQPIVPAALGGVAVSGNYRAVCAACDRLGAAQIQSLLSLMRQVGLSSGPQSAAASDLCLQRRS
jgi:hypothetical protein